MADTTGGTAESGTEAAWRPADDLAAVLRRDLTAMSDELDRYPSETSVWEVPPGIANSGGTLALHAAGNLMHYVGAVLGGTGYVRQRDREFADRDIPRDELRARLQKAGEVVAETLPRLSDEQLREPYPAPPDAYQGVSTGYFLLHLSSHLSYHRGQMNYHRRLAARR